MKIDSRFLAKVLLVSIVVFVVLPYITSGYQFILSLVTTGEMPTKQSVEALRYVSSPGLCPFFIFILVTPNLSIKKRTAAMLSGVAVLLGVDLVMTLIWVPYLETPAPSLMNMGAHYAYYVLVYYLLPFLLWFVFAFRQVEGYFRGYLVSKPS